MTSQLPPPVRQPMPPVDPERLARNWQAIVVELDAPRGSRLERLLRRTGVPPHVTRLIVATPALRRSWFVALGLVALIGLSVTDANNPRGSAFALLVLAPLGPVLGVALAYGSANDPAHEIHLATPTSGVRLLLTRVAAIVMVSVPLLTVVALLSPVTRPWAGAWLLPALAVSSGSLALMTYTSPRRAAAAAAVGWIGVTLLARVATGDALAAFLPVGQFAALISAVLFALVVAARRTTFDRLAIG